MFILKTGITTGYTANAHLSAVTQIAVTESNLSRVVRSHEEVIHCGEWDKFVSL